MTPGEYCFASRAIDDDGASSGWSTERCTATPLDDRGFTPRGGFVRRTQPGNLANTYSQATRRGASLTRNAVTARRIGVIVSGCGDRSVLVIVAGGDLGAGAEHRIEELVEVRRDLPAKPTVTAGGGCRRQRRCGAGGSSRWPGACRRRAR